jgi:hypothetical protein
MEPVEVCLRSKEGRELVLRAPGTYYNSVIRDADGRNVFVHFEFWALPDPSPVSAIPELRHSVPGVDRGKFYKANEKRRILIEVSSELLGNEGYESGRQSAKEHREYLGYEPSGLEHFTRRPCKLVKGNADGAPDRRECAAGSAYDDVYFGLSEMTGQRVLMFCNHGHSHCTLRTSFQGRAVTVSFLKDGLSDWRWYERTANEFLQRYVVRGSTDDVRF